MLADILVRLDGVVDRWLLAHLNQIPHQALEAVGATVLDTTRRMRASPGAAP